MFQFYCYGIFIPFKNNQVCICTCSSDVLLFSQLPVLLACCMAPTRCSTGRSNAPLAIRYVLCRHYQDNVFSSNNKEGKKNGGGTAILGLFHEKVSSTPFKWWFVRPLFFILYFLFFFLSLLFEQSMSFLGLLLYWVHVRAGCGGSGFHQDLERRSGILCANALSRAEGDRLCRLRGKDTHASMYNMVRASVSKVHALVHVHVRACMSLRSWLFAWFMHLHVWIPVPHRQICMCLVCVSLSEHNLVSWSLFCSGWS